MKQSSAAILISFFMTAGLSAAAQQPTHLAAQKNTAHLSAPVNVEDEGQQGVGIANSGYDGIALKAGDSYNFYLYQSAVHMA